MKLTIYDDTIPLQLELEEPEDGKKSHPLVIVLHGLTGNMEEPQFVTLTEHLLRRGFAVLLADLYGHGKSGGSFYDHTLWKWISNILCLLDFTAVKGPFSEIYLLGHSQGGLAAMLAAPMVRDKVKGLILLAPAVRIPQQAREGSLFHLSFDPHHIPRELSFGERTISGNYARVAQTLQAEEAARAFDGPVLFIHGEADERVPLDVSVEAAKMYKNAQLITIPGDTHDFDNHADKMAEAAVEWLR